MNKPLQGMRVLVTRARHQSDSTAERLESLGASVLCLPMIEILPPESWEPFDAVVSDLSRYEWIVFASANAVDAFFNRIETQDVAFPRFATIGPKTSEALLNHNQLPAYQAKEFVAESFVGGFPAPHGVRILWPKTNVGRTLIADELRARGAEVDIVYCYRTALPANSEDIAKQLKAALADRAVDVIMLASSQTAKNMRLLLNMVSSEAELAELLAPARILAIGPETAKAARQHLLKCDVQAEEYTIQGMIDALVSLGKR